MESSTTQLPRQCQPTAKTGRQCRAMALQGRTLCFAHDPALADKRHAARVRGGHARHGRRIGTTNTGEPVTIGDLGDVVRLLEKTVNDVLILENSLSRANCIARLAQVLTGVFQVSELEQRIARLEQTAGGGRD